MDLSATLEGATAPDPSRRRRLLQGAGLAGALLSGGRAAAESSWPSKPVRFVVAFPPSGLADVMMRTLQGPLTEALGQPVVIDNRAGVGGNLAGTEVVRNGGDGHTFLVTVTTTESVNPAMFRSMPFDPARDLQPVAMLANSQLFLITRPTLAVNTLAELVGFMRANPGKFSYGSAGNGTTPHLAGELFKQSAGLFATHIPYRGAAPAIQDAMAGQIDFTFAPGTVFPMVRNGRLKLLGVASRQRSSSYPGAPTFDEQGIKGVYADTLFGVYANATMPAEHVVRMNRDLNRLLGQPSVKARFAELGAEPLALSAAQCKVLVQAEAALFGRIVRDRNIRPD